MAGRRPTPTAIRETTGNPGKRPMNAAEPKPPAGLPAAPAHLSPQALAAWPVIGRLLVDMRVLTEADAVALEGMCEAYADLLAARAALAEPVYVGDQMIARPRERTYITIGNSGPMIRKRPEVEMIADADRRLQGWLSRFGLTPADRSRVGAAMPEATDPFDGILN